MTMKLYYSPVSTYSQKALLAFYEKGIAFEPHVVNLGSPDGRAEFEKINPFGKVPFLKAADDRQIPESTCIIEYLEDKCPGTPRLIPAEGGDATRRVRFMDRMGDFYYNDPVVELLFQSIGFRPKDEARASKASKYVAITYGYWEKQLATSPWLCGADFTMADCAAIPPMYYARVAAPFSQHPNISAYWARVQERPSYRKVLAEFEPVWKAMSGNR
jgi:glutathione S-transferase